MPLRLSWSAAIAVICLLLSTCACQFAVAARIHDDSELQTNNATQPSLVCSPFGTCEPCPEEALHEPFCRPFGNRRLVHCVNASTIEPTNASRPDTSHATTDRKGDALPGSLNHEDPEHPEGETLAWEACGRIPTRERADFYEFVACNILFTAISLVVLFARSKRLQAIQARQLAARIGLTRR